MSKLWVNKGNFILNDDINLLELNTTLNNGTFFEFIGNNRKEMQNKVLQDILTGNNFDNKKISDWNNRASNLRIDLNNPDEILRFRDNAIPKRIDKFYKNMKLYKPETHKLIQDIEKQIKEKVFDLYKKGNKKDIVGFQPHIQNYISGHPLTMINYCENLKPKKKNSQKLVINIQGSHFVKNEQFVNSGFTCLIIYEILKGIGYNIDLHIESISAGTKIDYQYEKDKWENYQPIDVISFPIKFSNDKIDNSQIYNLFEEFDLFFRGFIFFLFSIEQRHIDEKYWELKPFIDSGLGVPINTRGPKIVNAYYTNKTKMGNNYIVILLNNIELNKIKSIDDFKKNYEILNKKLAFDYLPKEMQNKLKETIEKL